MSKPVIGHCAIIYPPTAQTTIPYLHGLGLIRSGNRTSQTLRTIAATEAEFKWICAQLARRRAKSTTRQRRGGSSLRGNANLKD